MRYFLRLLWGGISLAGVLAADGADPLLSSWQSRNSGRYSRVYQGATSVLTTWPQNLSGSVFGGQSTPSYSDVQRVRYSTAYVYINATGLASYTMGPWYNDAAKTILFQNWPADQGMQMRFPRAPLLATSHTTTRGGPIGLAVNGVALFNGQDAFSYSHNSGTDLMAPSGDGYWNRDALLNEAVTFDPGLAHQQQTGQYHYHVNPLALRYQLGDHVTYSASTNTYAEATTTPVHSPILGWGFDGYPVYGPYGYSSPLDASSAVRRMVSGFVKRDGTHGTDDLAVTSRVSLPNWAVAAQNRTGTALAAAQQGPAVSTQRPLGYYQEDYDYLGDHGYLPGTDFDLNVYNARYCVTPEYPQGTWAYFVTMDSANASFFPYTIGPQYAGVASGGSVSSIIESVTDYALGGAAAPIAVTASIAADGTALSWTSVEGGTYLVEYSKDGATWATVASNVASAGTSSSYIATESSGYFRITLTALASYDTDGSGGTSPIGGSGSAQEVGATGTAYLINLSAEVPLGGTAGAPAAGFVASGSGSKTFLVRADGPALTGFGVSGALSDPVLQLYSGTSSLGLSQGWASSLSALFASLGAFPLAVGSKDAAIAPALAAGVYTVPVGSASGGSGTTLLEVYDGDPNVATVRLVNLSARGYIAANGSLTAGFVIAGSGGAQVLLRGVGPTLASLGVTNPVSNAQIAIYQSGAVLTSNSGWSTSANAGAVSAAASQVGAFALPAGSADSAVLLTLTPGAYTLVLTSAGGAAGTGLLEVYFVK